MAVAIRDGFEHGIVSAAGGGLYDSISGPPTIISAGRTGTGVRKIRTTGAVAAQWFRYRYPTPPAVSVGVVYITPSSPAASANIAILSMLDPTQSFGSEFEIVTDGSSNMVLRCEIYDGATSYLTSTSALTAATEYRLEWKSDWSGVGMKMTWGIAVGDGALTTIVTDFTGGNTHAAATHDWMLHGISGAGNSLVVDWDDLALATAGGDYPLGPEATKGYSPTAVGTHNLTAAGHYFKMVGATSTELVNGETTSWETLDDVPLDGADYVRVEA